MVHLHCFKDYYTERLTYSYSHSQHKQAVFSSFVPNRLITNLILPHRLFLGLPSDLLLSAFQSIYGFGINPSLSARHGLHILTFSFYLLLLNHRAYKSPSVPKNNVSKNIF